MKKTKLLMLGTVTTISALTPLVAITACGGNSPKEPVIKGEFVCEQPEQETVRGESACWYSLEYTGSENIPSDIKVEFAADPEVLNDYVLVQVVGDKKLQVGVQGIREKLADNTEVLFTLKINSESLEIVDQSINFKYTYLESKVRAISPKVEERQKTIEEFRVNAEFEFTDSIEKDKLSIQIENYRASDKKIGKPCTDGEFEDVTGHIQQAIKVEKVGTSWTDGDWVQFDIHFVYTDGENSWEQVIPGYTYQVLDISYIINDLTKECDIQIDITGNTVKGLKAVVEEGSDVGVLPIGTPINTPFQMTFDKSKSPTSWPDSSVKFYKFGSFVNPKEYSGGYHKYASVVVELVKSDDTVEQLTQTYTGDRTGECGQWWISSGGPITVIRSEIDKIDENWKSLIFKLRTTQEIKHDSSFYITYSDK